jgi:hypothetical protein
MKCVWHMTPLVGSIARSICLVPTCGMWPGCLHAMAIYRHICDAWWVSSVAPCVVLHPACLRNVLQAELLVVPSPGILCQLAGMRCAVPIILPQLESGQLLFPCLHLSARRLHEAAWNVCLSVSCNVCTHCHCCVCMPA